MELFASNADLLPIYIPHHPEWHTAHSGSRQYSYCPQSSDGSREFSPNFFGLGGSGEEWLWIGRGGGRRVNGVPCGRQYVVDSGLNRRLHPFQRLLLKFYK